MGERRNYIALDWVTGEIEETLQQARQSLEDYVSDREDYTKLRFCLTYAHQVHGSLKMVELHGAAVLAYEIEQLAQHLLVAKDNDSESVKTLEALMAGFLQLSAYLHRLNTTHQDQPASLLPTLNELRASRGAEALTPAALFNPDLQIAQERRTLSKPAIEHDEFNELIRKIRQLYQTAMVGIVRDQNIEKNYEMIQKVCVRLHKVSLGTASENLWKISLAVIESLAAESEPASVSIKTALRLIDSEIKKLQDMGRDALEEQADPRLLKSLLYTVARAEPSTELIRSIQHTYRLKDALPELDSNEGDNIALPDSDAISSVIDALNEELSSIQDVLDLYVRGEHGAKNDMETVQPSFKRIINTLSVLGATDALNIIRQQQERIESLNTTAAFIDQDELIDIAAKIISVQDALNRSKTIDDTRHINGNSGQIDQAHESIIREARNGLEQAKEAIIEFVASQWEPDSLQIVPGLLSGIRGGLMMVPLQKAARILACCEQYVREKLLATEQIPEWQMLDTLADAITSVEYYLECLSGDAKADFNSILIVAEESVAALGYPIQEQFHQQQEDAAESVSEEALVNEAGAGKAETDEQEQEDSVLAESEKESSLAMTEDEDDEDLVDDEIIEIFVEEAAEVLETIEENLPNWLENSEDKQALAEIRRAFHTLKGSGRMVGATDIGEFAWAVENMLNRVVDGTQAVTSERQEVVQQAAKLVPAMVEAFESRKKIDNNAAELLAAAANKLAVGEEVDLTTDSAASAESNETQSDEISEDSALLEIFATEATAHAQVLKNYINRARETAENVELTEDLQRALHTLKGSAFMAEVAPIAKVVSPVERLMKELRAFQIKADSELIDQLDALVDLIDQGLAQLLTTPYKDLEGSDQFVEKVKEIHSQRVSQTAGHGEHSGSENDSAAAMLVDGMENLLHASDLVSAWMENRLANDELGQLLDDLHKLNQVAEKNDFPGLSAVVVALCELYQTVLEQKTAARPELFSLVQRAHEALIDMMDMLAAGQGIKAADGLVEELGLMRQSLLSTASVQEEAPELADESSVVASEEVQEAAEESYIEGPPQSETSASVLDSIDEETLEIFLEEAGDLMEGIDESLHQWLSNRDDAAPAEELKRLLHTLKGGARLAGIGPLGDLSHAYESYLESSARHDSPFFEKLQSYQDRLQEMLESVMAGDLSSLAISGDSESDESSPLSDIDSTEDGAEEPDEQVDAEVIEIFLEEARDLHEAIDEDIHAWMDDREDINRLESLKRLLHTLKGGARLAAMRDLGNLSHNFETYLITSETQNTIGSDSFFTAIQTYQDQLAAMMQEIASRAEVQADATQETQLIAELKEDAASAESELIPADDESGPFQEDKGQEEKRAANVIPFSRGESPLLPEAPIVVVPPAAIEATRTFIENFEKGQLKTRGPQEVVKVSSQLLEELVNLAGETSISRGRVEEQISEIAHVIEEMDVTIDRIKGQLRRLEIETEAQVLFRQEQFESEGLDSFDPLEMDRYSHFQQLARSLIESATDIQDVKETINNKVRDMETLLLQQSRINSELQEGLMRSQMVPFSRMVPRLRRIVRQVSTELGKQVDLHLDNIEGELDRNVLERMVAPLEHMLRNAVDHGIESAEERLARGKSAEGSITLGLAREGGEVVLTLSDDGAGVDLEAVKAKAVERGLMDKKAGLSNHEILQFIIHAGFSTAKNVTQISGRGVGMDVVHSEIKQLGGSMEIQSEQGHGSLFTVRLPFTVSVNRALMVCIDNDIYAIPLNTIEGIVRVSPYELEAYYQPDAPAFEYAGQSYNLRYMGSLLQTGAKAKLEGQNMPLPVILVRGSEHSVAVQVDRLLGSREIVVKTLGPQFSMVEGLSGATVLGDGSVVIILDLLAMIRADASRSHRITASELEEPRQEMKTERNYLVMVVDDSVTVRKVTSRFLERQGMDVLLAKDGVEAMAKLQETEVLPDVMLLDIEMPRMDGFEVASRVRHSERLQQMPIIMITSRTGEKHRDRALSLGVNKYMGKPYQESELLTNIGELIGVDSF